MTMSAAARRVDIIRRSRRMPSIMRPSSWSGTGRREDSWRLTITSSAASMKQISAVMPFSASSENTTGRCCMSARLRTSMTTASFVIPSVAS